MIINGKQYRFPGVKGPWKDRHGKWRCTLRATGQNLPIPWEVGVRLFETAYKEAIRGKEAKEKPVKRRITAAARAGIVEKAVNDYLNSATFKALAPATRQTRGAILRAWIKNPDVAGSLIRTLRREDIERGMGARSANPPSANKWLIALRMLLEYCIESTRLGITDYGVTENPAALVKRLEQPKTDGFPDWTEAGVALFDERWKGTTQYIAKELLLVLGQRRGDVLRFGWHMVTPDGMIEFQQNKTGTVMRLPMSPSLLSVVPPRRNIVGIDGQEDKTPFLLTGTGKPFSPAALTNMMTAAWSEVGYQWSTHGARKLGAQRMYRRLLKAGHPNALAVTMAYTGHATEQQLRVYLGNNFEQEHYADQLAAYMA
jgi:integrase